MLPCYPLEVNTGYLPPRHEYANSLDTCQLRSRWTAKLFLILVCFFWICLLEILHSECEQSWIAQGQNMPVPLHKLNRCLPRFQWKSSRKFLSRWIWTVQGQLCFRTSWVYPSQEWVSIHYEASFPSLLPLQRQYKEQEKMVLIVDQCISAATKATDKGYLIHWVSTTSLNKEGKPLQSLPF